jgi:Uncharacterized membrane protein (homolog of Drosophila rhomboid)
MTSNNSGNGFFSSIPPVTKNIIIINFIAWIATFAFRRVGIDLVDLLGLHYFQAESFRFYQLISYMFLHSTASFSHIFFNMFAVYMFGRVIEVTWGPKRYLIYYMVTGIGAGLMQELVWFFSLQELIGSGIPMITDGQTTIAVSQYLNLFITIGASGAVFGVLLAFGMLFPNTPLFIIFIPIPIKAKYFVILYGLVELFMGVSNFGGDNVAHFAHLGGMIFGFILIQYWKIKNKKSGYPY